MNDADILILFIVKHMFKSLVKVDQFNFFGAELK